METLEALAALLSYFGRAEIRFRTLRFWPGRAEEGTDVAQYRAGWGAVILLPIFDGSVLRERARNLRKGEDVAKGGQRARSTGCIASGMSDVSGQAPSFGAPTHISVSKKTRRRCANYAPFSEHET